MGEVLWLLVGLWLGATAGALGTGLFVARRRAHPASDAALAGAPEGWGEFLRAVVAELRAARDVIARRAALLGDRIDRLSPEQVAGLAAEIGADARALGRLADDLEAIALAAPTRPAVVVAPGSPSSGDARVHGPILVVEDDPSVRELVALALRSVGFRVLEAADGPAALELVERQRPAAVVLDLLLPGMSGVGFAEELGRRQLRPGVPIVVLSAAGEARQVAERIRAEACLTKPFQVRSLLEEVARVAARAAGPARVATV